MQLVAASPVPFVPLCSLPWWRWTKPLKLSKAPVNAFLHKSFSVNVVFSQQHSSDYDSHSVAAPPHTHILRLYFKTATSTACGRAQQCVSRNFAGNLVCTQVWEPWLSLCDRFKRNWNKSYFKNCWGCRDGRGEPWNEGPPQKAWQREKVHVGREGMSIMLIGNSWGLVSSVVLTFSCEMLSGIGSLSFVCLSLSRFNIKSSWITV